MIWEICQTVLKKMITLSKLKRKVGVVTDPCHPFFTYCDAVTMLGLEVAPYCCCCCKSTCPTAEASASPTLVESTWGRFWGTGRCFFDAHIMRCIPTQNSAFGGKKKKKKHSHNRIQVMMTLIPRAGARAIIIQYIRYTLLSLLSPSMSDIRHIQLRIGFSRPLRENRA